MDASVRMLPPIERPPCQCIRGRRRGQDRRHVWSCACAGGEGDLKVEKRTCYPLLLLFKGDHPECKTFVGLKGGSTHHPCSICGTLHSDLHRLPEQEPPVRCQGDVEECLKTLARLEQELKEYTAHREFGTIGSRDCTANLERVRHERAETLAHLTWMSAHAVCCAFWRLGYVDVTLMAAIDLMHLVDLGIIPRILEHTAAYYCAQMDGGLDGLNKRWREMEPCDDVPRARRRPLFKIGKGGGIQICGSLKAHEYKAILQLFPNLVRSDKKVFAVWIALHHWYDLAHKKSYTTADLVELNKAALKCAPHPSCVSRFPLCAHIEAFGVQFAGCAREVAAA